MLIKYPKCFAVWLNYILSMLENKNHRINLFRLLHRKALYLGPLYIFELCMILSERALQENRFNRCVHVSSVESKEFVRLQGTFLLCNI